MASKKSLLLKHTLLAGHKARMSGNDLIASGGDSNVNKFCKAKFAPSNL